MSRASSLEPCDSSFLRGESDFGMISDFITNTSYVLHQPQQSSLAMLRKSSDSTDSPHEAVTGRLLTRLHRLAFKIRQQPEVAQL